MNARVSPRIAVTKKQKKIFQEYIKEEHRKQGEDVARRFFKLMCISLNDDFGFGKQRLEKVIRKINDLSLAHENDEAFWSHVDVATIDQIGIEFERENYNEMDR